MAPSGILGLHTLQHTHNSGVFLVTPSQDMYLFPNAVTMASKELSYLSKGRLCPESVDSMNSDSPKYFLFSGYKSTP